MTAVVGSTWVDPRGWVFVAGQLGAEHGAGIVFVCIHPLDPHGPIILPDWSPRVDSLQPMAVLRDDRPPLLPPEPYDPLTASRRSGSWGAGYPTCVHRPDTQLVYIEPCTLCLEDATAVVPKTWVANPSGLA